MRSLASRMQHGYARDLAAFLAFLSWPRGRTGWVQAKEADHLAYLHWRRHDSAGPQVAGSTWNRELAAGNQFYRWALAAGHVEVNPVPQKWRRPGGTREKLGIRSTFPAADREERAPTPWSRPSTGGSTGRCARTR
ncbi:site-specific integrase [Amycolatopsis sp. NPDC004368]